LESIFQGSDNTQDHKEQLVDLKGKSASSCNESATIFHNFIEMSPGLSSIFGKFIGRASSNNEIFKYWDNSSASFNMLKTLFVLTVMDIRHCICRKFTPCFPSLQPLIPELSEMFLVRGGHTQATSKCTRGISGLN
jgi:hypothetical protein